MFAMATLLVFVVVSRSHEYQNQLLYHACGAVLVLALNTQIFEVKMRDADF